MGGQSDIVMLDAGALTEAIRRRRVSCVEVMTGYLDHIDALNPRVNAIVALAERADLLAQARGRDDLLARGEWLGPLHGFPHAVKDLQPVQGMRSTWGSPLLADFVPAADSLMVERLRRAGAIIIGKTNVPEFGLGSHTVNPVYGATRNAFDQSRSAGGSSGGAAVALALRMVPVADGSDYGGSLRNPAAWNNVFGLRTSVGRVPLDALEVWLPSMGVLGPMARSVADLAMLLEVQAGYDARAPLSMDAEAQFQGLLGRDVTGLRIAWGGDFRGFVPHEPGVLDVCRKALETLESLGCKVEEALPEYPLDAVWQAVVSLRAWQLGSTLVEYYDDPAKRALLKPEARFEVASALKLSGFDVSAASIVRSEWYHAVRRFFDRYDCLVIPSSQVSPFEIDLDWPRQIAGRDMLTYHEWMKGNLLIAMAGCPSLAAPAGFDARGLPVGMQFIVPHRRELACLQLAFAHEAATRWTADHLPPLLLGAAGAARGPQDRRQ